MLNKRPGLDKNASFFVLTREIPLEPLVVILADPLSSSPQSQYISYYDSFQIEMLIQIQFDFMVRNNEGVLHTFGMTIRPRLYLFTDYISTLGMELQISDTIQTVDS